MSNAEPQRPVVGRDPVVVAGDHPARAFSSGTELKIGSWKNSGSSGKYIWVTSRCVKARPNTEKWMCAGRQALAWFLHGYAPGLMVVNR